MRYSTTSLSAITLCVCMMLSHHTNGMDMWGTPSPFTNNNPNQMPMTGQQWHQQPNTNMQFESNNWNNVATPMHPNDNQGQQWNQQRSAKIKFRSAKWSKAALSPDHPSNKHDKSQHMSQPQSAERMTIHTTPHPKNRRDLIIHFSGKYKFKPMVWQGSVATSRYKIESEMGKGELLVVCDKGNVEHENAKRFYDVSYSYNN
ncbi:hypothetical protein BDF22DRAFT_258347 [Syncephalis plumigaleata]|nr:hypothetical protein BDF22DRAFT_258347 [Syncephalis plumigaleata]